MAAWQPFWAPILIKMYSAQLELGENLYFKLHHDICSTFWEIVITRIVKAGGTMDGPQMQGDFNGNYCMW